MSLENVVNEILDKAHKQAEEIQKEGKKEASAILDKARTELEIKQKEAQDNLAKLKEAIENKEMASAKLLASKEIQEIKKQLIDETNSVAKKKISGLDYKQKEELLKKLSDKAAKELKEIGTVYAIKEDLPLLKKLCKNSEIKQTEDILGGAIFESKDKSVRVDFSFDQLLEQSKNSSLREISEALFGKQKT